MTKASQVGKGAMVDLALKKLNHHQSQQSQVHSCHLYLCRGMIAIRTSDDRLEGVQCD
jgi:hypothetical protein